ncbi:hypothetical protein DICPUDRAFT_146482 [Dictyostelium purpureum]|uniref:B box-type domain-containing protein n=1 Tax=Dictyostelium purpureum TaxID=5786 RepID=F0Z632_DICPU|nr:uncharacterized protein DICPUDRAFT_146482 [Dictyostelium purpureum]EGC40582.1 hypothetical protein DICPUDRAFT_146482 [Dictyostelium purpureum]|eukprot:XP_003282918.1 hypothetical protein DICPUDRAFT_146482 [Dictyostelium purpureum]
MSNNQQYDTKCLDHPHQDIISICSTCPNNTPVCIDCITGNHKGHVFEKLSDVNLRNQIQQEYNNQTIPKLNNYLENNKIILDESNNHFKQIKENHTINFDKTTDRFNQLKNIINAKENDTKRLLITKLDENIDVNNIITTTIENYNNKINNAIKYNNVIYNNIDNINNDIGFIELLKHNHQCNNLLSKINNNNLPEYKDTQLIIQENNLDSIIDLTNNYLEVVDIPLVKKDLKTLETLYFDFTIYEEGCDIRDLKTSCLAIGPIQRLPKNIPATVTDLLLLDYYNQPLNFIPPTVQYLHLQNIKYQLTLDSIPKTVTEISLLDGFDQPLNFIPPTVKKLYLQNIKYQLTPGSIPNHLANLVLDNGFSQHFTKGIIPDSIPNIFIGDVVYPLEPESISNSNQRIEYKIDNNKINNAINNNNDISSTEILNDLSNINNNNLPEYKDNQLIVKENILELIKDLLNSCIDVVDDIPIVKKHLKTQKFLNKEFTIYEDGYDINDLNIRRLAIGPIQRLPETIPATVTELLLLEGFNQPLDFIPPTVEYLYLYNIKYQLTPYPISSTVTHLYLLDGFDQPLKFIPHTVQYLYLYNIKYQLTPDSIPLTVLDLSLLDGFNQPLNFIPCTVQWLYLDNIKYQLKSDPISGNVSYLYLLDGFDQPLDFIPGTVKDLHLLNIKYQLTPYSIPATVKVLTLHDGFDQPLNFIPPTAKHLCLYNIKYQLKPDSIPTTVTHLCLQDGFDQPLNFIPPTVQNLLLRNIKYQLTPDSIPETVTHLTLLDGFNQPLNFIPLTVQKLSLRNIKYQLIPGSIPNHLTSLVFDHGFSQRFIKGIIPDSITYIYMCDVPENRTLSEIIYRNFKK